MRESTQQLLAEFIAARDAGREPDASQYALRCPDPESRETFLRLVGELEELSEFLPDPPVLPERIAGYRIEGCLGRGGMGVVYAARDVLGRRVALKILSEERADDPESRRRFEREISVLIKVVHPHVARVLELGRDGDRPFVVMEELDGESLEDRILLRRKGGTVLGDEEIRALCLVFAKIARALDFAHGKGVVHRDVKPANILFDDVGEPRIVDFGVAELDRATTLTATGRLLGTAAYIAPERLVDPEASADRRVDVYSLGVSLYEAITATAPFQGELLQRVAAARRGPPPPHLFLGRRLPGALLAILERSMAFRPARRYATAAAFADDLEAFARGEPVRAERGARLRRAETWLHGHRRTAAALLLAAAVLAIVGTFFLSRHVERRERVERLLASAAPAMRRLEAEVRELPERQRRAGAGGNDWAVVDGVCGGESEARADEHEATELQRGTLLARDALIEAMWLGSEEAARRLDALDLLEARWLERSGRWREAGSRFEVLGRRQALPRARLEVEAPPVPAGLQLLRYARTSHGAWPLVEITPLEPCRERRVFEELEPGSYLLRFRRDDGARDVRLPLLLDGGEVERVASLELPSDEVIGEGWEYVPPGDSVTGGDTHAEFSEGRRVRRVQGFFMRVHEVRLSEYLEYLSHLDLNRIACQIESCAAYHAAIGWPEGLPAHLPRDRRDDLPAWTVEELLECRADPPDNDLEVAVHNVSPEDALHYVDWLNRRAGEMGDAWTYSLPTADQWERAARGADGRCYTWGDGFEALFAATGNARLCDDYDASRHLQPGRYPNDRSPFGILDLVGNVREICLDVQAGTGRFLVRGGDQGCYLADPFRLAARRGAMRHEHRWEQGMRLVRTRRTISLEVDGAPHAGRQVPR